MQKSIEKPLFSAFLLVAAAISFPFCASLAQTAAGQAYTEFLFKPGTELTLGTDTPNPLTAFDQSADAKPFAAATIKETAGCATLETWEAVVVSRTHWRTIAPILSRTPATGTLAVTAEQNCVKLGHPAHIAEVNPRTGIMTTLGWFMPTAIASSRPDFVSLEDRLRTSAGILGFAGPVVFVSGRVIYYDRAEIGSRYAPRMLGVRIITRKQMESAIQDGTQIIDVRTKKQYSAAHVKGAVHVPYTAGPRMKVGDEYSSYVKAGDAFDIRRIDPDKKKPVILMSEGPFSDNVYRAAVVLRSEGWKSIFLFYEGFEYFARMMWKPPAASGLVETINLPRVLQTMRKASPQALIDVRSESEFQESTITGAVSAPYRERDDIRLHRAGLNGQILRQYGDSWTPPQNFDKERVMIIIGRDENDWRSYKASLIAKSLGYKRVYWYRLGFDAWASINNDYPLHYPIVSARKN